MRAFSILLLTLALSIPVTTSAVTLKPWVGFEGSVGRYTMGDVNRTLSALNVDLVGTPLRLWPIEGGPGCGLSAGLDLGRGFSLGAGYDRVFASSGAADATHFAKFRLPGNAIRGLAEYAFPRKGPLGAHVGGAAGKLMVTGEITDEFAHEVRGTAPLYEVYLGGDWWGQPRCGLFATLGYRSARVKEVKIDGVVALNPDGSKYRLDYSGMMLRLGLKVPLVAPADAPAAAATSRIRPWLSLGGSWGNYAMNDVNHDLNTGVVVDTFIHIVETVADTVILPPRATHFGLKKVPTNVGMSASAGLNFPGGLVLGIGCERLYASSRVRLPGVALDYDLPANTLRGIVEYRLRARGRFETRLGIAGGAVMLAHSAALPDTTHFDREANPPTVQVSLFQVKGSGALVEVYGSGEWQARPLLAVTTSVGYRYAKAGEIKWAQAVHFRRSAPYIADYSGLVARIGLKVALTK